MKAHVRGTEIFFDIDGMGLRPAPATGVGPGAMVERPIVFVLHGGPGGDHSTFKTQVTARLRQVAQLVYVDHRGSGRSAPADPSTYTLDDNIADLDALREHLGISRVVLLGSSYGGMVAQGYAIRYPEHISNLILTATAPSYRFMEDARQFVAERGTPDQVRVCQWLWDGSFESAEQLREYYRVMGPLYSTTFNPDDFDRGWQLAIRNFEQLNIGFGGFLRTFDYVEQLSTILCPTLVLAGAHDWICAPHHSELIAERIPRAHLKIFANSAHSIAQDEPDAYFAALSGFLTYAAL